MMVGYRPTSSSSQNVGIIRTTQDTSSTIQEYEKIKKNMSHQRLIRQENTTECSTRREHPVVKLATPESYGSLVLAEGNSAPAGDACDINPNCRGGIRARTSPSVLEGKPGPQHDMSSESTGSSGRNKSRRGCDIISPSSRKRASSHSHGCRVERNTPGDPISGEFRLEIGSDQRQQQLRGAKTNGVDGDKDLMCPADEQTAADRTAVDSLKAVHAQKKYFIRSAIWDENGDIGACNAPPLADGVHQKLRLCRSLDPNLLSDDAEQTDKAELPSRGRIRAETSGSLRSRPNKQKRFLRTIKSVDSVIPRSLEDSNIETSSGSHFGRLFSSPSTRRRFAYFSKLATGMKTSGSQSSPPSQGDHESPDSKTSPPSSPPPVGLTRGKVSGSPSSSVRLMPRKLWKKGYKPTSYDNQQSAWAPQGNGVWQSTKGRKLQLFPKPLIHLSDVERRHLKLVAQLKLQRHNLLGPVNIPRDLSEFKKKKSGLLKGGRSKATNFFDILRDSKDSKDSAPLIFGIPLEKCLQNDQELKAIEVQRSRERRESLDLAMPPGGLQPRRKSSRSLHSPQLSRKSSASSTALLEALSLSSSVNESHRRARRASLAPNVDLKIPRVVSSCFRFIEAHGLRTEGIFRVSGSKKRVRQIRESYDKGDFVIFTRDQSPHDVGALLKEYFRDLPEPLLTRDLYNIFTNVTKFEEDEDKIDSLRLAVCLLPIAHRDVLYALMRFLTRVAAEAERDLDSQGNEVPGSRMNANNLGTLFGPNILRKTKGGLTPEKDKDFHADAASHVERTRDVILSACLLINHYEDVFQIPVSLQEEVLRTIAETDPDALDFILNRRSFEHGIAEEPTGEEPPSLDNFGTHSVIEPTTSSSSGTFPCLIDDSSLASLSTIEDLVNERTNFSDFDANIPSIGSSDSLDALEIIPDSDAFNHVNERTVSVHARKQDESRGDGICNGPRVATTGLSPSEIDSFRDGDTRADGGLALPPPQEKRGSIGLYRETMLALGMDIETQKRAEQAQNDTNCNMPYDSCTTCSKDRNYIPEISSSTVAPRHNVHSSSVSSSPMSGSSSSSNTSLVHVDSGVAEQKKKLPSYDDVVKIRELDVKNYVTVNPSKYFAPTQHPTTEETEPAPESNEVQTSQRSSERPGDDRSRIRRRDHVAKHSSCNQKEPPPYRDLSEATVSPGRSTTSPSAHKREIPASPRNGAPAASRASDGGTRGKAKTVSGSSSRAMKLGQIQDRFGDMRSASTPDISRNARANSAPPSKQGTILLSREHDAPLLAWDHHAPREMGRAMTADGNTRKLSRAIMGDFPPKISLYNSWSFLDLHDDDGEFDGPETYV